MGKAIATRIESPYERDQQRWVGLHERVDGLSGVHERRPQVHVHLVVARALDIHKALVVSEAEANKLQVITIREAGQRRLTLPVPRPRHGSRRSTPCKCRSIEQQEALGHKQTPLHGAQKDLPGGASAAEMHAPTRVLRVAAGYESTGGGSCKAQQAPRLVGMRTLRCSRRSQASRAHVGSAREARGLIIVATIHGQQYAQGFIPARQKPGARHASA